MILAWIICGCKKRIKKQKKRHLSKKKENKRRGRRKKKGGREMYELSFVTYPSERMLSWGHLKMIEVQYLRERQMYENERKINR